MKNISLILVIFLILFSISVVAEEQIRINLFREEQVSNEVFQAEIILEETPEREISVNEVILLEDDKKITIAPLFFEIEKNHYFVYFDLPDSKNGTYYFFKVKDLLYKINNKLIEVSKSEKFRVWTKSSIVKIKPGFIKVDQKNLDFTITVIGNTNVEVNTSDAFIHPYGKEIVTGSRKFKFTTDFDKAKSMEEIKIFYDDRFYTIPVYIFKEEKIQIPEKTEEIKTEEINIKFLTELTSLNKTIKKDQVLKGALKFKNYLNHTSYNITFSLSGNLAEIVRLNQTFFEEIKPEETLQQYIWINEQKNPLQNYYSGAIVLSLENYRLEFPIFITIEKEISQQETPEELFEIKEIQEEPIKKEEEGFNKNIIILLVIAIIIIIIILFPKKQKPKFKSFKEYVKSLEKR